MHLAAGAAALPFAPHVARAQAYPSRPVKIVVGQAAGSATDIVVRLFGQSLSEKLGQQFIIEIRPGAAGNIATEAVTHMPPDGYSLLAVNSQNAINVALYEKLNFDFVRDIAPIALVETVPLIMEVHPSVPAKTVVEFVAYAKANPGKLNMASAGIGGPQHIAGELFKFMAGVDLARIPYRGSTPAVTDLVAGQVQVMFDVTATALPQVKAGTTRALGVTTKERLASLPDVPTIGAPAATPPDIIATLNKLINTALGDPRIRQRLIELGVIPAAANSPGEFAKFISDEVEKWSKVIKFAGIKPE